MISKMLKLLKGKQTCDQVFLVGHGRDGSTLLQHLINSSSDGAEIRGENLVGLQLASVVGTLIMEPHFDFELGQEPLGSKHPWFGVDQINKQRVMETCGDLFRGELVPNLKGKNLVGFKEIRWFDLPNTIVGVRWIYPEAKFLVLERNPTTMSKSGWWQETELAVERITQRQELARDLRKSLGNKALTVSYEGLFEGDSTRAEIESFLGHRLASSKWKSALLEPLDHPGGRPPWQLVRGKAT